ncbi:cAMP-regulated phosphoprotein 19-A-like isoform X2 [Daphnia pulicaria]|uniref:cAMP-regulated phosphoprotein 19-A-like isoform X2 n=1 Tax=Daphnia pulicaria TaxID=35523 RepID=UPI001EE9E12F|nr:cAMP-regulated phosphoprotein 19-A-like isoform X2 [Daphnia pulicaria]
MYVIVTHTCCFVRVNISVLVCLLYMLYFFHYMATLIDIEKLEEEKLKARYNAYPVTGHSAFFQKRLAKGQKYFDSGDYQMAKQKGSAKILSAAATAIIPPANLGHPTGDAIPTPESVPTRKTSIIQRKLASPAM